MPTTPSVQKINQKRKAARFHLNALAFFAEKHHFTMVDLALDYEQDPPALSVRLVQTKTTRPEARTSLCDEYADNISVTVTKTPTETVLRTSTIAITLKWV